MGLSSFIKEYGPIFYLFIGPIFNYLTSFKNRGAYERNHCIRASIIVGMFMGLLHYELLNSTGLMEYTSVI